MTTESRPLVSIGVPVRNGENFLPRALDSLLQQEYQNTELIVSDNASEDGTWEICQQYAKRDKRIRLFRQVENIGAIGNFEFVLNEARGPYFFWAACDDYWCPQFVTAMVRELAAYPDAAVSMSAVERIREDGTLYDLVRHRGRAIPSRMSHLRLALALAAGRYYHLYIYGLYRTNFLRKAFGGFPSVMAGDRLFMCQLALATRFCYVDEVLHRRQVHDAPVAVRYQDEGLGQVWKDSNGKRKMTRAVGPYLWRSRIVPARRKLWIPLIVLCFGVRLFVYTLVYAISGWLLGAYGRKRLGQMVRSVWTR